MKILFVRHGQSEDDLTNSYGGWADFPLTNEGANQVSKTAEKIKQLNIPFTKILTSPLLRAKSGAQIISEALSIPVEEFPFVKERNTYGILTGMNKEEAKQNYSQYVEALDNDMYVLGSERDEDIKERAKTALKEIEKVGMDKNIIIVTHSNFLKAFISVLMGKKIVKKEDGGMIMIELNNEKAEVMLQDGIEIS